jgi:hypothetical protein
LRSYAWGCHKISPFDSLCEESEIPPWSPLPREADSVPHDQATSFAYAFQWPSSRFGVTRGQNPPLSNDLTRLFWAGVGAGSRTASHATPTRSFSSCFSSRVGTRIGAVGGATGISFAILALSNGLRTNKEKSEAMDTVQRKCRTQQQTSRPSTQPAPRPRIRRKPKPILSPYTPCRSWRRRSSDRTHPLSSLRTRNRSHPRSCAMKANTSLR